MSHKRTALDRLNDKVKRGKPNACWEWQGTRDPQGYGFCRTGDTKRHYAKAHRLAYIEWVGPIPRGKLVMHKCDNPPCCNPKHLKLGTHGQNRADCVAKGRQARGVTLAHAKLKPAHVRAIRIFAPLHTGVELARKFHVSTNTISRIINRKTWNHV